MADALQEELPLGDAEPAEPKKRAVRTRKTKAEKEAEAAAAADEVAVEATVAPRRGRRKKSEIEAEAAAAAAEVAEGAEEKPKRTRRTTKKADVEVPAAADSDVIAEEKPKRGRRKAVVAEPAEAAETSQTTQPATEAAGEAAEFSVATGEHVRRARRASKKIVADLSDMPPAVRATSAAHTGAAAAASEETQQSVTVETVESDHKPAETTPSEKASRAQADAAAPKAERVHEVRVKHYVGAKSEGRAPASQNTQASKQKQNGKQPANANKHNRKDRGRKERIPREYVPSVSKDELAELKLPELREKAGELNVDASGMKKAEMIDAIYEALAIAEGFVEVGGILDILPDGYGFLRTQGYLPGEKDVYVGLSTIRRNGLRKGDYVYGRTRPAREGEKFAAIQNVISVNDVPIDESGHRPKFAQLTPVYPDERLLMEHGKTTITARVIDLVAPIGKGQRGLIVSPPKAGKTTILKDIAAAISANNPEVYLMCLLVDERPEEVTDMERSIKGEVISSTFDMPSENHIAVSELVIERAKRLVELGHDVVILLDSITRLARAYNLAQPASGRVLSGGVDSTALYPPKRFLGAARNIEGGGSLTILASALIETGSKMDEVIFEEFKGTGNMELRLDRGLADRRIFPAIDPVTSGTRKEDLLLDTQEAPLIWAVRRLLANMNNTERAMEMLIRSLKKTETNQEFLMLTAKKAQGRSDTGIDL